MPERPAVWTRDEIILACALIAENDWRGMRADQAPVQELSGLLQAATIHPIEGRDPAFRSANSVQRKTFDLATQHPDYTGTPTKGNRLDRVVLAEFLEDPEGMRATAAAIRNTILSGSIERPLFDEIEGEGLEAPEGALLLTQHLVRERDPRLRREKLRQVAKAGQPVACEVCGFDFGAVYGPIGDGYIEVHHRLPLHASGPRPTKLTDLVLLCSNCHRMIHRSKQWLTPEQLREHLSGALGATVSPG